MKQLIQYFLFLFFILSLFCPNFCYEFTPIKNYVSTSISLTIQIPYAIFQYKNAPYQPDSGVVLLKFLRGNNNYCKIYVYKNFSDIKESIPGVFINYDKQKYIDIHKTCSFDLNSGTYYIVIASPNYNYKDTFEIFNGYEYYELAENEIIFKNWTDYTFVGKRYFYFKTPKLLETKYFHVLGFFKNTIYYSSTEFIIKKEIDGETIDSTTSSDYNYIFKLEKNHIYTVTFKLQTQYSSEGNSLYYALYYSNYARIEPLDKYSTLSIPILTEGRYYYFHINIEPYEVNEKIYFKYNKYYKGIILFFGTFYQTIKLDEIEKNLPNYITAKEIVYEFDQTENEVICYVTKINNNDKSLVISMNNTITHLESVNLNITKYSLSQKISSEFSRTYQSIYIQSFYIDESSFNSNSEYIIIFSNNENIIHITSESPFIQKNNKFYILNKTMVSSLMNQRLDFDIYNPKKDSNYYFEVKYINDISIYYFNLNTREELINFNIIIDNCEKPTYFYGIFNDNSKKDIFIGNVTKGDAKIYYKIDNLLQKTNNLFNFIEVYNLISYPTKMQSKYDLFQIKCSTATKIQINYYKAEKDGSNIHLNYGDSTSFYIEGGKTEVYHLTISLPFYYKIMLFKRNDFSEVNFSINNKKISLTNDNYIFKEEILFLKNNEIFIHSNLTIFITFNIATNRFLFETISSFSKSKYLNNNYDLFLFSNSNPSYQFANLYFLNNGNNNPKICIHKDKEFKAITDNYIFIENKCINFPPNSKYYIEIDNPNNNNYLNYISLYISNYDNIIYDFEYRNIIDVFSYNFYDIILTDDIHYKIFKYYNNDILGNGELRLFFNDKLNLIDRFTDLYVYFNKKYIHETMNIFENYVYKISLKGYDVIYYNTNTTSYLPIGYWYFVVATDTGKKFEDTLTVYNKNEYYILSENIFTFNYTLLSNDNDYVYFKIPPITKYLTLHYEWYNSINEYSNSITINNEKIIDFINSYSDNYEIKDKSKDNIIRINFKTTSINKIKSRILLYLTENKKVIYLKNDLKPFKIPILSPQIIYIFNDLSRDDLNENVYYKFTGYQFLSKPRIKFYNTYNLDYIINSLPSSIDKFEIDLEFYEKDIYYYNKKTEENKYGLIGIEVPFSNLNEYSFQKTDFPRLITSSFKKIFLKNETKDYYINYTSFKNNNSKILLFTNRSDIISFNGDYLTKFYNKGNSYLITYDMLNDYPTISFSISASSQNNDYIFEVRYLDDNINIYYYNKQSRLKHNNMIYEINDCSKKNYIFGIYETIEPKVIFYVNKIEGNGKIFFTNSINELDEFFKISPVNLYRYPFEINSKYEYIQLTCSIPIKIQIIYYIVQKEKTLNLEHGSVIPFYIEKNSNSKFFVNPYSILFMEKFFSKIELIKYENENELNVDILFNNISINLNQSNSISEIENDKLIKDELSFLTNNFNCFILLYISIDKYSINYISKEISNYQFENTYNLFLFPSKLTSNKNSMANIYIINKEKDLSSKICYNKAYGNIEIIYNEKNNCFNLSKGQIITFSLEQENPKININDTFNYYIVIYASDVNDFDYTYNFYKYDNILSYIPFGINIIKNDYKILSFSNQINTSIIDDLKGEIMFKFEKGRINGSYLYIYHDKKNIHFQNNDFDNYAYKLNLSNDYLFTYNISLRLTYYFVITTINEDFHDKIIIYNPIIPNELNILNIFNTIYESDLVSDSFLFYVNNTNNSDSIYLHYQWSNYKLDSKSSIKIFNTTFIQEERKTFNNKSGSFEIEKNSELYILINEDNSITNQRFNLNLLFYFSHENQILSFPERNIFKYFPIITTQNIYFYCNISKIAKGEDEYIKVKKLNNDINIDFYVKFYENDDFIQKIPDGYDSKLNLEECDEKYCKYYFEKINELHKSSIIIVQININKYINSTSFEIALINEPKLLSKSFTKQFSKGEIGYYKVNEKSFIKSKTIIIKSDIEEIIHLNNTTYLYQINGKKIYILSKDLFQNNNTIYLSIYDENSNNDFNIEILTFDSNYNIVYLNSISRNKKYSYTLKIKNCNNFNGFIGVFNESEKGIFYIEKFSQKARIYYKKSINSINEFIKLNDSFTNLYTYPFEYDSYYDFIQVNCIEPLDITFYYYQFQPEEINLEYGMSIPFFIKNKNNLNYIIKNYSEVLNKKIKYKIEIIPYQNSSKIAKFSFGGIELEINNKNPLIKKSIHNLNEKNIIINSIEGDILLFFSIGINKEDIDYYSYTQKNLELNKNYIVFLYLKDEINSSNFSTIYIKNNGNTIQKICYNYLYDDIDFIFINKENKCVELVEKDFISILFENPKVENINDTMQDFIFISIEDPLDLICDYTYISYNKINNYELYTISFSSEIKYKILYFDYEEMGNVIIKFIDKMEEGTKFYLYYDKKEIHYNSKEFDGEVILKENINNINQISFSTSKSSLYFIIFNENGIINKTISIIGTEILYKIPSNILTNFSYYSIKDEKYSFNYEIQKLSKIEYLNTQWVIQNRESKCSMIIYIDDIETPFFTSEQKSQSSEFVLLQPNIEYKILFNVFSRMDNIKIDLFFNFDDNSNKISLMKNEIYSLPIIAEQIIYLIQPIKSYSINENMNYAISNLDTKITIMVKYFETTSEKEIIDNIDTITKYDKILSKGDCENNFCYYLNKKENNKQNYLLTKIDIEQSDTSNFIKFNIFTIKKIYSFVVISSSVSYEMEKFSKKLIKFNYDSILINQSIIIFSNYTNSISIINNDDFISGKTFYVINKQLIYNDINFELFNNNFDFKVDVEFVSKNKVLFSKNNKNRKNISYYRIKIDNCEKENYYYGIFDSKDNEILYVELVYGDAKIYSNDYSEISSINDLYNFNKIANELSYPKIIKSEYDIIQFSCTIPSLINIHYYDNNLEQIQLNYGNSYGIYIKNGNKKIFINKESEIYNNSFSFEIKLIVSKKQVKRANVKFNGKNYQLDDNNNIIRDKNEKIIENEIELKAVHEDYFVIITIGLKNNSYIYISDEQNNIIPNKNYSIFLYPKNNENNKFISSTITIKNTKQFNSGKICISQGFYGIQFLEMPQKTDCISLNKEEKISYITEYPYKNSIQIRKLNEDYNNYFFTKLYFENPQYLSITYSFEKEKNKKDTEIKNNSSIFKTLLIIVLILLIFGLIAFFIYKKKYITINPIKYIFNKNETVVKKMELTEDSLEFNGIDDYPQN